MNLFHAGRLQRLCLSSAILLFANLLATAREPAPLPETTPWDIPALQTPPSMLWVRREGPVHSLLYRGLPYQAKPTQVFAYYASPLTVALETDARTFPGIVLVHGGGGKAFATWAETWARRGYAAIAMDLAGCGEDGQRLPDGGPDQSDQTKFRAIDGPLADQWTYHAVADVLLAHSLLLSLPEVDKERTAVTGISWGGYLTCIVAGLDQRFKVAMPVYGCGFLQQNSAWVKSQFDQMSPEQVTRWVTLWDPSRYIGSAIMPLVFLNGTNDFAYPLDSYAKTCRLVAGEKNYSIQLRMDHGHIFDFPEFFVFIDQYLKSGTPMAKVARPCVEQGRVTARVTSATPLVSARLHYTAGPHLENPSRPWTTWPLEIRDGTVVGQAPPPETTVWYVDVTDQRQMVSSSEVMVPGQE